LDEPVGQDTTPLSDLIADGRAVDPLEKAIVHEERREVRELLRLLPERHREVLVRRYGFNDNPEQSHEEIGQWLGVGEERSRQIEREALHRLRAISGSLARAA
jgi:RNA polymerase sigma factor (sigma-70 family)